jgi:carbon-monoxide dehydrogenase medium subunit
MTKQPTAYYRPDNLPEALRLLQQPHTVPLAGGTKLIAADITDAVVDLQALGLDEAEMDNGRFHIGASITLTDLAAALPDDEENSPTPLLRKAIRQAGPNTYRNSATPGGSVASRLADSELLAALLVLDAALTLRTPDPVEMRLADYLAAEERPYGLITAITIPWENGQFASERVARTPADYPIVSVTAWRAEGGSPRLAATGIAARPLRLTAAEEVLADGDGLETAAAAAQSACDHPGDFRGTAAYRAEMTAVLTRRVLSEIL